MAWRCFFGVVAIGLGWPSVALAQTSVSTVLQPVRDLARSPRRLTFAVGAGTTAAVYGAALVSGFTWIGGCTAQARDVRPDCLAGAWMAVPLVGPLVFSLRTKESRFFDPPAVFYSSLQLSGTVLMAMSLAFPGAPMFAGTSIRLGPGGAVLEGAF